MEWCDLDEQMVQLGLVPSSSHSCSSSLSSTGGGSGGSLVAASAFEAQCVDQGRQLLARGATALVDGEDLLQVLALFDEALEKAPTLKPFAVRANVCMCVLCVGGDRGRRRWASLKKQQFTDMYIYTHTHTYKQWERGFALYYLGRFKEAQEQFMASAAVDEDDVEPILWRFLVRSCA